MKNQIHIFFNALSFFTRIPSPNWVVFSDAYRQKSLAYFSMIGVLVGAIGAFVFYGAVQVLPVSIAILLNMIATIYVTGAMHEDGFADVCDGFGGGWNKEKILLIMKDPRMGAYGVIGIFLLMGIKFSSLYEIPVELLPIVIISGHSISRYMSFIITYSLPYVSNEATSKSKGIMIRQNTFSLLLNTFFGISPLLLFQNKFIFLTLIPTFIGMLFLASKFKKWIGGQTGDCAGATQQFCEAIFYISFVALWKYI